MNSNQYRYRGISSVKHKHGHGTRISQQKIEEFEILAPIEPYSYAANTADFLNNHELHKDSLPKPTRYLGETSQCSFSLDFLIGSGNV